MIFTKQIKIVQLLLLCCVVVQGYVVRKDRPTRNVNPHGSCNFQRFEYSLHINLLWSQFTGTFRWVSDLLYPNKGRSLNDIFQLPLEDQSAEEIDDKLNRRMTADGILEFIRSTAIQLNLNTTTDDNKGSSQKSKLDTLLLKFTLKMYRWVSDLLILNLIGEKSFNEIFQPPLKCQSGEIMQPLDYYGREADDIAAIMKSILQEINATTSAEKMSDGSKNSSNKAERPSLESVLTLSLIKMTNKHRDHDTRIANNITKLMEMIAIPLKYAHSKKPLTDGDKLLLQIMWNGHTIHEPWNRRLDRQLYKLILMSYQWILNLRKSNVVRSSLYNHFQPVPANQSPLSAKKSNNKDQKINTADISRVKGRSFVNENELFKRCGVKIDINTTYEFNLLSFLHIVYQHFTYTFFDLNKEGDLAGGRSFNEFHIPLESQTLLPMKESDSTDQEITADFILDNVRAIIKEFVTEESKKTPVGVKTVSLQKIRLRKSDYTILRKKLMHFTLVIYRWTSDTMILNTVGRKFFDETFNDSLLKCRLPAKENNKSEDFYADKIITNIMQFINSTHLNESFEATTAYKNYYEIYVPSVDLR